MACAKPEQIAMGMQLNSSTSKVLLQTNPIGHAAMPVVSAEDIEQKQGLLSEGAVVKHLKDEDSHYEDTPAYACLRKAGLLCDKYRRRDIEDIFTGKDLMANSSAQENIAKRFKSGYYCGLCCIYKATHVEMFVPAGHVGKLMNEKKRISLCATGHAQHYFTFPAPGERSRSSERAYQAW